MTTHVDPTHRTVDETERSASPPSGRDDLLEISGQTYYVVRDVDRMAPFLMSIVSDGDRWMFISSSGGLTAGRGDAANALFPYETDDRLHLLSGLNGSATAIRIDGAPTDDIWRPTLGPASGRRHRNLYKSVVGDSLIFEEEDAATGLRFRYRWETSDRFGFVRTTSVANQGDQRRTIDIIDGIRNILPHGLDPSMYLRLGNLTNAYKRSELIDADLRLAVYSLESQVSDRAEPADALRASVAWSTGFDGAEISLRSDAIRLFEWGSKDFGSDVVTGLPGGYFLVGRREIEPGTTATWHIVADVGLDQPSVASLVPELRSLDHPEADLAASIESGTRSLVEIMARADALQRSGDAIATAHHFSNVTYNVMRGGLPMDGYTVEIDDFLRYLEGRNRAVTDRHRNLLQELGPTVTKRALMAAIADGGDVDLSRLGHDYLPFSFSRRHGDPSRPWNSFSIRVTHADGRPRNYYEGNWRDIFQNWEATAMSFPDYLPDMVSVFVNASTPDGFNPYRITSEGIDWEIPDPDDPWSNIGYWGDHQITYLLRLLEASDRFDPGSVARMLTDRRFTYAAVPYRIVPYDRLSADPKSTIDFDDGAAGVVEERVEEVGADGRLVWRNGAPYHVTLAEKLLVPALAKLSNFVPEGGIWMNTQRPEWNDANNALVGYGLSMVTLYQLRRYLVYLRSTVAQVAPRDIEMSSEVAEWLTMIVELLGSAPSGPDITGEDRKLLVDRLGSAFSDYREQVYADGFTGTTRVPVSQILSLCDAALPHLDVSIEAGRRPDGLFDSYNTMDVSTEGDSIAIESLGAMLEGQVAVIESGALDAAECASVVEALFRSDMYRPDQGSFMLYPARELPPFLDRNVVPEEAVDGNSLLRALLAESNSSVIVRDIDGKVRFAPDLETRDALEATLDELGEDPSLRELVADHGPRVVRIYEEVFGHLHYTGRSGSMYGYEGIGSIYWHMVAKLLVAIQDATFRAQGQGAPHDAIERLRAAYGRVRLGLGFNKTPEEHGAIPIDPYSHTPAHAGAQQPGMTGLVKEELLVRPAELGVVVRDGEIAFDALFLSTAEFLVTDTVWSTLDLVLREQEVVLPTGSLGLTMCQVPVVVSQGGTEPHIDVDFVDGTTERIAGMDLGRRISEQIFTRSGQVTVVRAHLPDPRG